MIWMTEQILQSVVRLGNTINVLSTFEKFMTHCNETLQAAMKSCGECIINVHLEQYYI